MKSKNLQRIDASIRRLERQLAALEPAESIQTHIQFQDGKVVPPMTTAERTGEKDCIVCQVIDGRRKQ